MILNWIKSIWLVGHSKYPGAGDGIQTPPILHWCSFLCPLLFSVHKCRHHCRPFHLLTWLLFPALCWWHSTPQLLLSFPPLNVTVSTDVSSYLYNISTCMKEIKPSAEHLSRQKFWSFLWVPQMVKHNFTIILGSVIIIPTKLKNLEDIDICLNFNENIFTLSRACRYCLYNIQKSRPYLRV